MGAVRFCKAVLPSMRALAAGLIINVSIQATVIQPGDVRTPITDNRIQARQSAPGSAYRACFEAALRISEKEEWAGVAPEQVARHWDGAVFEGTG
ncbi:hypothetical protein [Stigmatella erecta]|uniref:Uncharacterized protein n=1 Tax=Stigmatella erecta TaxID=83460 RepID=A0A1H9YRY1_9BACT|nr:hypothetical protein [Stigmatella erecta]SES71394.1 hypothetical protein SAMN05443639_10118 [Stigmatella erecta]